MYWKEGPRLDVPSRPLILAGRRMIGIATKFLPTPETYAVARQSGFRRAELWTDAAVLSNWSALVPLALSSGLGHAMHFPNRIDQSPETLEHVVALSHALDCSAVVIHQPHFDRHSAALVRLTPSLRLAVENHKLTPDEFLDWAGSNPGLTLDVEHLWKFTLEDASLATLLKEVRLFLARFADKLVHVHLPGYLPGQAEHRPMYCSRDMVLGVLSLLEEARFAGLIVSEVDQAYQNVHDLQMDVLLFQRWQALQLA
jgi:hypothetical protein